MTWEKRSASRKRPTFTEPCLAHAGEVVAPEVDEHDVLGAVLLGREQPLDVVRPPADRAGDRVDARAAAVELDERLRRRSHERDVAEVEEEVVRGRVDPPQRPVDGDRTGRRRPLGALGEDDLERVAGADVLDRPAHALLVVQAGGIAAHVALAVAT